ncbi:ABC transporter permease [Rhizobium azibense]|uniref:Transport permease protein n=1 Tax=Rhizobium azibense TaxID=1136135 RepID=A0A4R3RLH5_9HYPH|nr:ABC transporter permease [Rhizobium azibense]TCU32296.1 capsular polysaccharide transport system permease protein [Rhizobium azibense]
MYYLTTHIRVVAALLIREMSTRFGNKPGGYIWAILDPAAHIAFMSVIFMAIARLPALGTSFPLFFATGYIAFQFYAAMCSFLNGAIKSNRTLLSYPNVAPIDTIVARYVLQAATTIFVAICVLGAIIVTMHQPPELYWPAILEAALAATLLGLGFGIFNTIVFLRYPFYEQVFNIVNRPMFLISGVFFLPDALPGPMREIVLFNPLVHVVMLFRQGFYPQYRAAELDMFYLYSFVFTAIFAGLFVFTNSAAVARGR